ncbi:MAG: RtcB family protein [Mangrovibacterium sp.]
MIELKGKYNNDCKIFLHEVEEGAIELVQSILDKEVSQGVPVRIMPDTHVGKGIVIGFTMPLTNMVNPNYIGVDIGCSVSTYQLNKRIDSERLPLIDHAIRRSIPMGMRIKKSKNFNDNWVDSYFDTVEANLSAFRKEWKKRLGEEKSEVLVNHDYIKALCKKIGMNIDTFYYSVGTLGGGNHFIEIGESANSGTHFLTIHSGSRNFGLQVCNYHAKKMLSKRGKTAEYLKEHRQIVKNTQPTSDIPQKLQELNEKYKIEMKEQMLEGDDMYEYLNDMIIAQTYAQFNHGEMSKAIFKDLGDDFMAEEFIYSMHNFIDPTDWIIRKGAIRSYAGEKMIIPFNMRDGILICEGKSNADWNFSAPHGAGRVLARNKAFKILNMDEFSKEMEGIYSSSVCRATLDESPMAYKDKQLIIDAIAQTANIIDNIRPILNIKAR